MKNYHLVRPIIFVHIHYSDLVSFLRLFTVRYDPANPKVRFLAQFYYYSGDCKEEAAQVQIKTNFLAIINQQFVPFSSYCRKKPADCTIANVNVFCGEAAAPARRRRRSVREVYVKVDFLAKEKQGTSSSFADLKNVGIHKHNLSSH